MKNLNIYLIRHGEKTDDGSRLSENGKEQAKFLAKRLAKLNITKIYSSDLKRCEETTKIINKELNLRINFEEEIKRHFLFLIFQI